MLAPRKSIDVTGIPTRRRWIPSLEPLGFSLRLNLWYAAFFVLGAFILFTLAYVLLARQLAAHDRDTVRVKLEAYSAWYIQGGVAALQLHFKDENDWEKATTFLEVRSSSQQVVFNQRPGMPRTKRR